MVYFIYTNENGGNMLLFEVIKFIIYSGLIVIISKYILVKALRALAEHLDFQAKTVGQIAGIATSVPEFLTVTTSSVRGFARSKYL